MRLLQLFSTPQQSKKRPGLTCRASALVWLLVLSWAASQTLAAQLSRPDDPPLEAPQDAVQIYLDFPGHSLGRSPYRRLRLSVELSALELYRSYPVAEPTGWSTAVFLSKQTEQNLLLGRLPLSEYIRSEGGIHHFRYRGIRIAFGLEAPSKAVFDLVAQTYAKLPKVAEQVTQRYRSGYTIRIYEAENVLEPENQLISYPEAILAATIIGDREQWLWGIHDGRDLLNSP